MAKRKASAFAKRVGAGIRSGLSFIDAVKAAKGGSSVKRSITKVKSRRKYKSRASMAVGMVRRRSRRVRHYFRGIRRSSPKKLTLVKGIKLAIAFGPVTAKALQDYQAAGGGLNGISRGVLPSVTTAYTGYNTNDGKFYPQNLVRGYVPLFGAWLFGKVASRFFH